MAISRTGDGTYDSPDQASFWAVSDLHLHPSRPDVMDHFRQFLELASRHTSTLVILGDLFDYWIGPYSFHKNEFGRVFEALSRALSRGLSISFVGGNRDFLAGQDLCRNLDIPIHRTRWSHQRKGVYWLGLHGDTLCHRDTSYQCYRRLIQNRHTGEFIRGLPGTLKTSLIRRLRETSQKKVDSMKGNDHQISPGRVRSWFRRGVDHLICGHLHTPGHQTLQINGTHHHLWVLGDWFQPEDCVFFIGDPNHSRLETF